MADETDYVWDPDWSHRIFINIRTDISSQAITKFSINKDYVRITPIAFDATPLDYNALFTDRTGNSSLNCTFLNTQEKLNGTRNLAQQDIQTPSHFVIEEIVRTMPRTTQQSISPIHPTLTTPRNKTQHFRKQLNNPRKTFRFSEIFIHGLSNI